MEYFFLKGFLLVLILQRCTAEGLATSAQSSMAVAHHDGQALPQESELPAVESVPVVSPPSLEEVHQAVQEASEQVEEGRGAEEVLKELLERVVEAAMGQVEGGNEGKSDEAAVQEVVDVDEKVEAEADIETEVEEEAVGETAEGGDVGMEEQEAVEVDAIEEAVEESEGIAGKEGETAAGTGEETTGAEAGGGADGTEVIDESLDTQVSDGATEEAGAVADNIQAELSDETGADETETQKVEESLSAVDVAVDEETVEESEHNQAVIDVEQLDILGEEEHQEGEAKVESDESALPSDNQELEGEGDLQEVEEEVAVVVEVDDGVEPGQQDYEGHLVVEGGAAGGVVTEGADVGEAAGGDGESEVEEEESVTPVEEGDEQRAGGEEQTEETSQGSETEGQETLVISATEPEHGAEASIEQNAENQAPTLNPSTGRAETGENTLGEEKSDHSNEIITPTDELLPHNPEVAKPTLDNAVNDVQAEPPQAELEEQGQTNELVEDSTGTTEMNELGLEAWKIGAIAAAVFLVLETVVIVIYILKCRNKNKNSATQRACEEGCVEPEAATGGDCSDDTLPAVDGDAQQIAAPDLSEVASTLARNKEQHNEQQAIAMSDVAGEESVSGGPGPDSSPDIRTSIL